MILVGDNRETLPTLDAGIAKTCVTSPPYWGLRDYGHEDQIGLESTPDEYVAQLVAVFREVRRVLSDDGTLWLNLGDSYAGSWGNQGRKAERGTQRPINGEILTPVLDGRYPTTGSNTGKIPEGSGLKPKDLIGIPWRVAFALQADGWFLRSDIIWAKPNPMPSSVTDRPTSSHEHVFLLSKSRTYFYDADAIAEPSVTGDTRRPYGSEGAWQVDGRDRSARAGGQQRKGGSGITRNARDVWTIGSKPYSGAHFATMPPALAKRCILAGSRVGDTVIDPFLGSGTTGQCAERLGRKWIGCELQEDYVSLIEERTAQQGLGI